jgi:hypothetical protein
VLYQKTLFRAFLHLEREEVEEMTINEYMDNIILLRETLQILHAPFNTDKE